MLGVVLMVAINHLATQYLTREISAVGARVAYDLERGIVQNPIPHGLVGDIQVVDARGRVVSASESLQGKPPMATLVPPPGAKDMATTVVCDHALFPKGRCEIVVATKVYRAGQSWTIYSAAPVVPFFVHPMLVAVICVGVVLLTGVITYGAYRLVTTSLVPVDAIRSELDEINATCPQRRVPVPPGRDEIHDLAVSVNHTLGRLQISMEQQRQFASDASHDLRSPLTAMRAEVEDAMLAPAETDVTALGCSLLRSLDRLQAIVSDLLTVARFDAGVADEREPVNLSRLVGGELDRRHPVMKIKRDLEPEVIVIGDSLRLARLLTNLLDNAERHAETEVAVTLRAERGGPPRARGMPPGTAVLEVIDDGAGIEPEKHEIVFQRFTRLDAARNKDAGGTGLGLPIARQIAELSGGTLTIEPSGRGARLVVRLPLAGRP
ncbi:sensor histidine kinase [Sphaerisporangium album]|uniref:histidine kinase n=2 Tax=Sphaerisporangium album TaxID=509200 RepID=A0A367FA85_9ACTN|nr:sensor histidine kinase [Sphaerisporangium album]